MEQIEFEKLLQNLVTLPEETETVEFKVNYVDKDEIGKRISALSNVANLRERLGIGERNYPTASVIIRLTIQRSLIKESERPKEYIPWWS